MSQTSAVRRILFLLAGIVVLCLAAFAWMRWAPRRVPQGQPPLATLGENSLPAFREVFNANEGQVRIVAMLSPT